MNSSTKLGRCHSLLCACFDASRPENDQFEGATDSPGAGWPGAPGSRAFFAR